MKKLFLLLIIVLTFIGCNVCNGGPAKTKRSGESYYPFKVCSIGDTDGSTCVTYAAKDMSWNSSTVYITTLDGHEYKFNYAGWSIVATYK